MSEPGTLHVDFTLRGLGGRIDVSLTHNTDPDLLGYSLLTGGQPTAFAADFPVCHATVAYPADGYAAVFGWTQLVRSTDGAEGFEMDPIAIYRDLPTLPSAGTDSNSELFDAPSRESRQDMDWEAHSFLCVSPDAVITVHVRAIAGFTWGFTITGGRISLVAPKPIGPEAWDGHLSLLSATYPSWIFDAGYRSE